MSGERWVVVDRVVSCQYCKRPKLAWLLSRNDKWYLCNATFNAMRGEWVADRRDFHDCPNRPWTKSGQNTDKNEDENGSKTLDKMEAEIVAAGYRAMAQKYHPDHGGDTRVMQEINRAITRLRNRLR